MATQRQIAELVGVDVSLVSHALRGDSRVSEATRLKVVETARELGYGNGSNHEARALIARRYGKRVNTDIIAVITRWPMFQSTPIAEVPFFRPFFQGIETEACEREIDLFLCSHHRDRLPRLVRENQVDGVISLATLTPEVRDLTLPVVTCEGHVPGAWSLQSDDREGTRLATRHLIELGHRKIAYVGYHLQRDYSVASDRQRGYEEALKQAGLPVVASRVAPYLGGVTQEEGAIVFEHLWRHTHDFSAVVCFNDLVAMGVIEGLRSKGLRVPEDVSVTGFDDVSTHYEFEPKITSIGFDRFAMGRRAVEIICTARQTGSKTKPAREVFAVELVPRTSTSSLKN